LSIRRRSFKTILYSFVSDSETTTPPCFRLIFLGLCNARAERFVELYQSRWWRLKLWNLHNSILCPSLCTLFHVFRSRCKVPKTHTFWNTRHKFFYKCARTVLLELICEVMQIIPCFDMGIITFLNEGDRVCIAIQYSLRQLSQLLIKI